jgi:hypothetical protein
MNAASDLNTATVLPDGEVLVIGDGTTSAELYNPATGTWALTGSMNTARFEQTATLLPDGNVLVAGGGQTAAGSAELYNPATGKWTLTGNLHTNRLGATATLLGNGEVLVAGGDAGGSTYMALSSAELYNPATGTWSLTGSMSTAREGRPRPLANGKVLVAGGLGAGATPVSSAELYNPATGKWASTGAMSAARQGENATLLPDGDVLATAGIGGAAGPFAESYDPATGQWSPAIGGSLPLTCIAAQDCRLDSTATLLGDGDVLVAGGLLGTTSNGGRSARPCCTTRQPAPGPHSSLNPGRIDRPRPAPTGGPGRREASATTSAPSRERQLYTPEWAESHRSASRCRPTTAPPRKPTGPSRSRPPASAITEPAPG